VAWTKVYTPTVNGGLGIIELDKFSRALRLRWLWYSWDDTARPWKSLDLPIDITDIALFNAATNVTLATETRLPSGPLAGCKEKHLQPYTRSCSNTAKGRIEQFRMR